MSREISPEQQSQFLTTEWNKIPHAQLLPLIQRIALTNSPGAWSSYSAFKFWCEDWPGDCAKAMLSAARDPTHNLGADTILLIPEEEHPELDGMLRKRLEDPQFPRTYMNGTPTAALVLRTGSKNLVPFVDAFLDNDSSHGMRNCQVDGYLDGFLLRVAPADGTRRLATSLQDGKPDSCGDAMLRALKNAGSAARAMPVLLSVLNGSNLINAGNAALFLGECGPESARAAISKRLEALQTQWHDRAAELASAEISDQPQWNAAQFEQELVSALAHATAWKLTSEEAQSLAAGCLTDQCRQIAEGKGWRSL